MIITLMAVATLSLAQHGDTALLRELIQIENEIARANRECDRFHTRALLDNLKPAELERWPSG